MTRTLALGCWLAVLGATVALAPFDALASTAAEPAPGAGAAIARFAQLPLSFEANRGQTDEAVQFLARGRDHTIYLTRNGATIALQLGRASTNAARPSRIPTAPDSVTHLVRMTLVGAHTTPGVTGLEPNRSRVNYLVGNDSSQWQRGVPTFARVRYAQIHPGVDLEYYGNQQQLEYDFVVAAGADPSVIAMHFEGADRVEIDSQGDLVLHVADHQLRQLRPVSYQVIDGRRRPVSSRFVLKDSHTVGFALGEYDRRQPLTIDPTLSYSTFFGGSKGDVGWAIAVDAQERAYIAGETLSTLHKLDDDAVKTNAANDAFVARLDSFVVTNLTSTNLSLELGYLTYLGGHGLDGALGVAVDAANDAYITGYTTSSNFPTFSATTAFQPRIGGTNVARFNAYFQDAFVTKLDTNGGGIYSTYLGGSFDDAGRDIAVDAAGSAYIVGYANSMLVSRVTNSVVTTKCTNNVCGGSVTTTNVTYMKEVVPTLTTNTVIKKTSSGEKFIDTIVETTPIGSNDPTNSPAYGFPVTSNAFQTNNGGNVLVLDPKQYGGDLDEFTSDLFVAKLSPDGSILDFGSYLGGSEEDFGYGIAVDPAGNFTITGYTTSTNFPATNAFQSTLEGSRDAVVAKFDASGNLIYSTFLGGTLSDSAYRVATDAAGFAYVAGATSSSDFPSTPNAFNRGGIYLNSGSGTNSWTNTSSGLTHTVVRTFLPDPFTAGTFYSGTPRGVFKSIDGGTTWTPVTVGLSNRIVNALVADPFNPNTIYAGTAGGVFQSTDAGLSWTNRSDGLGSLDVRVLQFHPTTSNLWAGTARGAYQWPLGATNWTLLGSGLQSRVLTAFALNTLDLANVYAGTTAGIFKSTNGGVTWKASNAGLKSTQVRSVAIAPDDATLLYVGTVKGLYKSTNAAVNWSIRTNGLNKPQINALLIDPTAPATIYAGSTNGLFKSVDSGENWVLSQTDLTTRNVASLTFDPATTATLYAGTSGTNFAGGTNDAFLVKLAPDGQALAYAFTLGGNKNDEAAGVAVDADGFVTLIGQTASKNLPIAGFTTNTPSYQTNLSGKVDAFVARFDPTGATNVFSMFFGGKKNDFGHAVALDPAGNAYIVGRTESGNLPTTTNRLENVEGVPVKFSGGGRDAFVAKLVNDAGIGMLVVAQGNDVVVSWRAPAPEFILETRHLGQADWTLVSQPPVLKNGRNTVVLPAATAGEFFRLRTR